MTGERFLPGFRLSGVDVLVLTGGAGLAVGVGLWDVWVGMAVVFVVMHFFLFCNVLRMSRRLELIWAGVFAAMAAGAILCGVAWLWWVVFGVAAGVTVVLARVEMGRASYHGVGWRRVNPGLEEWWRARRGG